MADPALYLLTLFGVSCQMKIAWKKDFQDSSPNYSEAIKQLAAIELEIRELIANYRAQHRSDADVQRLERALALVGRSSQLLLEDFRRRGLA
jgi:hypothetical protein